MVGGAAPGFVVRFVYGPWAKVLRAEQLRDVIAQKRVSEGIVAYLKREEDRSGAAAPWLRDGRRQLISRHEFWKAVYQNREMIKMADVEQKEADAVYELFEKVDNTGDEPQVRLTTLIAQLRRLPDRSCGGALRKGLLRVYRWRTTRLLLSFGYAVNAAWLICALRVVRSAHATDLGALLSLALAWSEAELWELMLGGWALVMSLLWLANALSSADDGGRRAVVAAAARPCASGSSSSTRRAWRKRRDLGGSRSTRRRGRRARPTCGRTPSSRPAARCSSGR